MPPLISEDGTLTVHGQEGIELFINFQDDVGNPRDVSGAVIQFKTPGFSKNLVATATVGEMRLDLGQNELPNLIGQLAQYAIIEVTGGTPSVHYFGKLIMIGWR